MVIYPMIICPKCGKPIPAWKLIFLTNFNTITCPTCSAKLRANNRIHSLIGGGVGGGLGGLLVILWFHTKEVVYLVLLIALVPLVFLAAWLASIKFTKLEVLE